VHAFKLVYAVPYVSRTTRSELSPSQVQIVLKQAVTQCVSWCAVPVRAHEKRQGPKLI